MKHLFLLSALFLPLTASAQDSTRLATPVNATTTVAATVAPTTQPTMKFGYFSYSEALQSMPEYAQAQNQLTELRNRYDAEAKRAEDEFNAKYEDFLDGQRDFPPTILKKRQSELAELMAKNTAFRDDSRKLLAEAERTAYAPLYKKLDSILKVVGEREGFAFIINTDNNACPYINSVQGKDINQLVKDCLK